MRREYKRGQHLFRSAVGALAVRIWLLLMLSQALSGCYMFDFFKEKNRAGDSGATNGYTGGVAGQPLGSKAGAADEASLAAVYAVTTTHAPAAIRPDPDLYVRRLLRQYRPEGATIARQIGEVEQFRLLLGGASEDFSKTPQETYDATSLLAVFKVAQEVCRGLVAPNASEHGDWVTILPHAASAELANVQWLAQRILGRPSSQIDASIYDSLIAIMDAEEAGLADDWRTNNHPYAKYIAVCATLALDAEALYL